MSDTTQNREGGTFKVTGDWASQSKQLKEKFAQLTDSDLKFEAGKEHELLGRLETKLNKKRDEVINIIKKASQQQLKHRLNEHRSIQEIIRIHLKGLKKDRPEPVLFYLIII